VAQSLLPYLEQLALSHGRLADATGFDIASPAATDSVIRELVTATLPLPVRAGSTGAFSGFAPLQGWGETEGPVPEAFLPRFHWGYAPATELLITAGRTGTAHLCATALTYCEQQTITVELNGQPVLAHAFERINQKETLAASLPLVAGENIVRFTYSQSLVTAYDPRKLAAIFLSLHVLPAN
jgi:hypothetical protein